MSTRVRVTSVGVLSLLALATCDEEQVPKQIPADCSIDGTRFSLGTFINDSSIEVPLPAGEYCLELDNGPDGHRLTSAAKIAVDENPVFLERDFNQEVTHLGRSISTNDDSISIDIDMKSGKKGESDDPKTHAVELFIGTPLNQNPTPDTPVANGSFEVGPEGGLYYLGPGASISFPQGSVPGDTQFTFERVPVAGNGFSTDAVIFSPQFTFDGPKPEIRLPLAPGANPQTTFIHVDGEILGTTVTGDVISAHVPHFCPVYGLEREPIVLHESHTSVRCYGPDAYWHTDPNAGLDGSMLWTLNNQKGIADTENYCVYDFDGIRKGRHEFQVWIPPNHATATACYELSIGGTVYELAVDQSQHFSAWVSLGVWDVDDDVKITLTDVTTDPHLAKWVGFDAVRALPSPDAEAAQAVPECGPQPGAQPPTSQQGKIEYKADYHIGMTLWGSGEFIIADTVDLIRFDGVAADALRSTINGSDGLYVLFAMYMALSVENEIGTFIANDYNLSKTLAILAGDPVVAMGEALDGLSGTAFDLAIDLIPLLKAKILLNEISASTGDLYILMPQYPEFELEIEHRHPNGRIAILDDLSPDTVRGWNTLSWWSQWSFYNILDEASRDPDGFTLGKANDCSIWTDECETPMRNSCSSPIFLQSSGICDNWCYDGYPGDPCELDNDCKSNDCEGAFLFKDGTCK